MSKIKFVDGELENKEECKKDLIQKVLLLKRIKLNLDNPVTIQDKLNYLKIYGNNKLRTRCADKIELHNYCIERLGKDICVPIIKIFDKPEDLLTYSFPNKFVLKCNHGWNMNIVCGDINKFNRTISYNKIRKWLNTNFGENFYEIQYLNIPRKCFAEKYLDSDSNGLVDYKFWCFNGEPKLYTINSDNCHQGSSSIVYYDMNHNEKPMYNYTNRKPFSRPKHFNQMVEYAKKLSEGIEFVRIDFYEVNDTVYLGEMTFTPGAATFKYNDPYNKIVGDMLKL